MFRRNTGDSITYKQSLEILKKSMESLEDPRNPIKRIENPIYEEDLDRIYLDIIRQTKSVVLKGKRIGSGGFRDLENQVSADSEHSSRRLSTNRDRKMPTDNIKQINYSLGGRLLEM